MKLEKLIEKQKRRIVNDDFITFLETVKDDHWKSSEINSIEDLTDKTTSLANLFTYNFNDRIQEVGEIKKLNNFLKEAGLQLLHINKIYLRGNFIRFEAYDDNSNIVFVFEISLSKLFVELFEIAVEEDWHKQIKPDNYDLETWFKMDKTEVIQKIANKEIQKENQSLKDEIAALKKMLEEKQ